MKIMTIEEVIGDEIMGWLQNHQWHMNHNHGTGIMVTWKSMFHGFCCRNEARTGILTLILSEFLFSTWLLADWSSHLSPTVLSQYCWGDGPYVNKHCRQAPILHIASHESWMGVHGASGYAPVTMYCTYSAVCRGKYHERDLLSVQVRRDFAASFFLV